ncbi:MAG: LTA synthase family protein [Lachnospiraceae bacterium]|nr:LTA synthase family protein [Lachnospiraceae bacterium]
MKNSWKYISVIASLAVLAALALIGRASITSCVIFALIVAGIWVAEKKEKTILTNYLLVLLLAVSSYYFNDLMAIGKVVTQINKVGCLNIVLYLSIYMFLVSIVKKWKITVWIPTVFFMILGIVNSVVKAIRSTPISGGDIFSLKTAMTVAGSYTLNFDMEFWLKTGAGLCFLAGVLFFVVIYFGQYRKDNATYPVKVRAIFASLPVAFWLLLIVTNSIISFGGVKADYWTHETNGFAYNLYLQLKEIVISEPEEYKVEELQQKLQEYSSDEAVASTEYPNIIAIMNESFADLEVLGEFETNKEVLPVLKSLQENTIQGDLYVSIYGGNTANSEYEFLTGQSICYFSERVVPYQMYLHEEKENLFTQMKDLGYETVFMHPYGSYGWNRVSVYNYFGVDRMFFEEDMDSLNHIRQFATDSSQYELVKELLEENKDSEPMFIFDVTVQNHGGYTGEIEQLKKEISLQGKTYEEAGNYLNLVHESDRALGEFLQYLENYEEPVAVIFFGDHQPAVESEFVEAMTGYSLNAMPQSERQKMYITPYFIWTNYDIEEKQDVDMSLNYLSSYAMEILGLPMTGHQKYLMDLYEKYPVINTVGIMDAAGNHISYEESDEKCEEEIEKYHNIIYNYMFDDNTMNDYFKLK